MGTSNKFTEVQVNELKKRHEYFEKKYSMKGDKIERLRLFAKDEEVCFVYFIDDFCTRYVVKKAKISEVEEVTYGIAGTYYRYTVDLGSNLYFTFVDYKSDIHYLVGKNEDIIARYLTKYLKPYNLAVYYESDNEENKVFVISEIVEEKLIKQNNKKLIGVKDDESKLKYTLIPHEVVTALAKVFHYGATKYQPDNWKHIEDKHRILDALWRHLIAYLSGEEIDQESGLPHIDHLLTNAAMLSYFHTNNKKEQHD
jgi:hypothetical protein